MKSVKSESLTRKFLRMNLENYTPRLYSLLLVYSYAFYLLYRGLFQNIFPECYFRIYQVYLTKTVSMSNIHGFRDYNNSNNNQRAGQGYSFRPSGQGMGGAFPLLGSQGGDPRKESMADMFKYACCPSINLRMFTPWIVMINLFMFVFTLFWGGLSTNGEFLQPETSTLNTFGAVNPCPMQHQYQLWRYVTALFLHDGFLHILMNTISLLIFGCLCEVMIGTPKTIWIYFISGIGGNLMSVLEEPGMSVGASTGIAGLVGAYLAYIIVNWEALDYEGSPRCLMLCFVIMIILFNAMNGMGGGGVGSLQNVNNWGHFGGLLTGTLLGMAIIKALEGRNGPWEQKIYYIGSIGLTSWLLFGFAYFYLWAPNACF